MPSDEKNRGGGRPTFFCGADPYRFGLHYVITKFSNRLFVFWRDAQPVYSVILLFDLIL